MTSDPISDMLAAITNANHKLKERVDLPASALKKEVAQVLKDEGYIVDYKVLPDRKQGVLRLFLKYLPNKTRAPEIAGRFGHVDRLDLQRVDDGSALAERKAGRRSARPGLVRMDL